MAIIKLLNTKRYSKLKGVSRITLWRRVKNNSLDCYVLPGNSKKWFAEKEPDVFRTEQKFLDEILSVDVV